MSAGPVPVASHDRLDLLDALRGLAIGGVFVSNAVMWFDRLDEQVLASVATPGEDPFGLLFILFLFGKAMTALTVLFGIGFSILLSRAEERGASIVRLYSRRLVAMLVIGLLHMSLLWNGDILTWYAVAGLALLLFRRRSDRALLVWSLLLVFLAPLLISGTGKLWPLLTGTREAAEAAAKATAERLAAVQARAIASFSSGTYADVVRANLSLFGTHLVAGPSALPNFAIITGKFLLGFLVGRRRLFQEPERNRLLFRRILVWGIAVWLLAMAGGLVLGKVLEGSSLWGLVRRFVMEAGNLGLGGFYMSAVALLFLRPRWRRVLSGLAPAGRMALTNYLCQSALCVFIFYGIGLGLLRKVGPWSCVGLSMGLFGAQMLVSRLWLSRFRFGPVEWTWRTMTYGKVQPMRQAAVRSASAGG